MMLSRVLLKSAGEYWRDVLQARHVYGDKRSIVVSPRHGPQWTGRILVWQRQPVTVVSVAAGLLSRHGRRVCAMAAESLVSPDAMAALLLPAEAIVEGPLDVHYTEIDRLPRGGREGVRPLRKVDAAGLADLRRKAGPGEWDPIERWCRKGVTGQFIDETLVAIGGYEQVGDRVANIAVFTAPECRRKGYGRAVAAALARAAMERGLLAQFLTDAGDKAAARFLASVGAERYATTLSLTARKPAAATTPGAAAPDSPALRPKPATAPAFRAC